MVHSIDFFCYLTVCMTLSDAFQLPYFTLKSGHNLECHKFSKSMPCSCNALPKYKLNIYIIETQAIHSGLMHIFKEISAWPILIYVFSVIVKYLHDQFSSTTNTVDRLLYLLWHQSENNIQTDSFCIRNIWLRLFPHAKCV